MADVIPLSRIAKTAAAAEHVATFWTLRGAGRDITCSAYRVATGLELRAANR